MEFIKLVIDFWYAIIQQAVASGFVDILNLFLLVSFSIIALIVIWRNLV